MTYSTKAHYCHEEVRNKKRFDKKSFRSKFIGKHVLVFGCPKGQYNKRSHTCRVKPLLQKILHPQGEDKCPVSGVHFKSNSPYKYQDYLDFVLSHHFNIEAVAVGFILYMKYTRKLEDVILSKLSIEFLSLLKELVRLKKFTIVSPLTIGLSTKYITYGREILQAKIKKIHPSTWKMIQYFVKGVI